MQNTARSAPRKLEDDDFSVAPSLDVEMRSVVSKSFEDVYVRGEKVSSCVVACFFFVFKVSYGSYDENTLKPSPD
jgi:hypothetical protein